MQGYSRGVGTLTLEIPRGASGRQGERGLGMAEETDWRWVGLPPLDPSTALRVSGPSWGWIDAPPKADFQHGASVTRTGSGMIRQRRTGSHRGKEGYWGRTVTFMAPVDLSRAVSKASVTEVRGYWWVCMKPTSEE